MPLTRATGTNNSAKQISVTAWNGVIDRLEDWSSVISDHGAVGDGATNDLSAINAAILAISNAGGGVLWFPPGTYIANGTINLKSNVELVGYGAIIQGTNVRMSAAVGVSNFKLRGLEVIDTGNSPSTYLFDIYGTEFALIDFTAGKSPSVGGYIGYIRDASAAYGTIRNFTCYGSNGVYLGGHDHSIIGFDMTSVNGDDAWVIKANQANAYNINISNGIARNYSSVVAFGSEIGTGGANDSTYSRVARNILVSNVLAQECSQLIFIKAGANSVNDFRDGTLEEVTVSNSQLIDMAGTKAKALVQLLAGRGARVRGITFNNCVARMRCPNQSSPNAGVIIQPYDYVGGTAATVVEDIYFNNCRIIDVYDGAPNSGSAPGYPLDYTVYIEKNIGNGGTAPTIGRIEFNGLVGKGTRRNAVYLGTNLTGPIVFRRGALKNFCHTSAAAIDMGAFGANSKVDVKDMEMSPSASAPAGTRPVMADGWTAKTVEIVGEQQAIGIGDLAAGATTYRSFVAPLDCWIRKIELVNRAAIAAHATNKVTITVDNKDTAANLTTKDTNTGFALSANTPVSIAGADQFTGANSLLPKSKTLDITIASGGTATLAGAALLVHYVPYGAA